MPELNFKLDWDNSTTTVSNVFIDKYMPVSNPSYSVVYLLLLRHASANIKISPEEAAEKLGLLESDVLKALKHWDKEGLLSFSGASGEPGYSVRFISPSCIIPKHDPYGGEPAVNESAKDNALPVTEPLLPPDKNTENALPQLDSSQNTDNNVLKKTSKRKISVIASRPQYTVEELEVYKSDCAAIDRLFKCAESALAKLLSFNDLSVIFSLYDWLRLPVDVIELLLNYCADNGRRSVRYIEKTAIDWAENEINTVDKALAYINVYNRDYSEILKAFGISKREPSQTEITYMKKWIQEYKMPIEVIVAACDKTIMTIGHPKFAYADSIIESWNAKQVKTLEAVNEAQEKFYKEKLEACSAPSGNKKTAKQTMPRTNRFINFKQRDWDYEQIEKMEREYIENSLAAPAISKA